MPSPAFTVVFAVVPIVNPIRWQLIENRAMLLLDGSMFDLCKLIVGTVIDLLRSRAMLEAEILMLRQQINVVSAGCFPRCMIHLLLSDPIP
jgi:hypothetical protein